MSPFPFSREFLEVFIPTLNDALRPAYEKAGRAAETATAEPANAEEETPAA